MKIKKQFFDQNSFAQMLTIIIVQTVYATIFSIFYSGLSVYLTTKGFTSSSSGNITGLFLSINYLLPLFTIYIPRWLCFKNLLILSLVFCFFGLILIDKFLYLGLSFFLLSSPVNICINFSLTQLYNENLKDQRRVGFLWNYFGMNIGFFLGYLLTGYFTLQNNYASLIKIMALIDFLILIYSYIFLKEVNFNRPKPRFVKNKLSIMFILIAMSILLLYLLFNYGNSYCKYFIFLTSVLFCGLFFYAYKVSIFALKPNILRYGGYSILTTLFWGFYMLTPIAIMQLINTNVSKNILGIHFAPQWFSNINLLVIFLFTPILSWLIKNKKAFNRTLAYYSLGLLIMSFGFITLSIGIKNNFHLISPFIIIAYLVCLGFAELLISPLGDSLVGELIPENLRILIIGTSRLSISIGVLIATLLSKSFIFPYLTEDRFLVNSRVRLQEFFSYSGFLFLLIVVISCVIISKDLLVKQMSGAKNDESYC